MVILSAFVAYLLLMIVIGVVYMKKTSSSEDYFLGGRGLNAWVAALSAQASDMSGWLLMGLPGAIYSLGTGQIWIAVGLFIGTVFTSNQKFHRCIFGQVMKQSLFIHTSPETVMHNQQLMSGYCFKVQPRMHLSSPPLQPSAPRSYAV